MLIAIFTSSSSAATDALAAGWGTDVASVAGAVCGATSAALAGGAFSGLSAAGAGPTAFLALAAGDTPTRVRAGACGRNAIANMPMIAAAPSAPKSITRRLITDRLGNEAKNGGWIAESSRPLAVVSGAGEFESLTVTEMSSAPASAGTSGLLRSTSTATSISAGGATLGAAALFSAAPPSEALGRLTRAAAVADAADGLCCNGLGRSAVAAGAADGSCEGLLVRVAVVTDALRGSVLGRSVVAAGAVDDSCEGLLVRAAGAIDGRCEEPSRAEETAMGVAVAARALAFAPEPVVFEAGLLTGRLAGVVAALGLSAPRFADADRGGVRLP